MFLLQVTVANIINRVKKKKNILPKCVPISTCHHLKCQHVGQTEVCGSRSWSRAASKSYTAFRFKGEWKCFGL